jgi:hypothetical protein
MGLTVGLVWAWTMRAGRRLLPYFVQPDDLSQEVHLQLLLAFGPGYMQILDTVLSGPGQFKDTEEYKTTKKAFSRAVGSLRSTYVKRLQRGLPQEVSLDGEPVSCRESPMAELLLDLTIDLCQGLVKFTAQERKVWSLLRKGFSDQEVGERLDMDRRRVWEIRRKLTKIMAEKLNSSVEE